LDSPRDNRIARHSDAVGVRNNDWSFKEAALINPRCAGHFAVAVQAKEPGVNRVVQRSMTARHNSGHVSAHRTFANLSLGVATHTPAVADFDPSHLRNR